MSHVEIGKTYRHFKGTYHQVLNVALDSETQERMVVYNHKEDGMISENSMKFIYPKLNSADYIF